MTETRHRPDADNFCVACPESYPCSHADAEYRAMPETPTAAELEIPARTLDAFQRAVRFERDYADDLREIVAPVVAAELRRIADQPGMGFMTGPHDVSAAARLRARADELDPPARKEDRPMDVADALVIAEHPARHDMPTLWAALRALAPVVERAVAESNSTMSEDVAVAMSNILRED